MHLTTFLIIVIIINIFAITNSSIASQKVKSRIDETKYGTKIHYEIITPTFWDLNQTHNITLNFQIDEFGENINIIEGLIGLHVKDNNNFTHYYGFHSFGPFIDIKSVEDLIRFKDNIINKNLHPPLYEAMKNLIDTLVFDVYGRIMPVTHIYQFTIDLFLFDLIENVKPTTIEFYLSFNFYETTLDQYPSEEDVIDSFTNQEIGWVKGAEYRIDPLTNNRSVPSWLWVILIVLLLKFSNIKKG